MAGSEKFAGAGVEGLDEVLQGGYVRSNSYLIYGSSGAGKTTLSLQFLLEGARQGEKCLYIGAALAEDEVRGAAESHGWNLDGVDFRFVETAALESEQTMLDPGEVELPRAIDEILRMVDEQSPQRVVLDSLTETRVLSSDPVSFRRQLMRVRNHLISRKTTALMIDVPGEGSSALNSLVSGVIELEQIARKFGPDSRRIRVVKVRGSDFTSGYHSYQIRKGGLEVFPRLIAAEARQTAPHDQTPTGLAELDSMLYGGLFRGVTTLLIGPSGTGKSALATQFAVTAAERNERVAMFVFDERVETLLLRAAGLGLPLQRHIDEGRVIIRQVDPTEMSPGELSHVVKELVEQQQVQTVILDSLNGYAYAMPEERMLSIHLHELSSFLNLVGVTTIVTMTQHGMLGSNMAQPFDVSYVSDTVILFRHFEHRGSMHKALAVYKNRPGAHETTIRELSLSSSGLALGEPLRRLRGIFTGVPRVDGFETDESPGADSKG